MSVNRIADQRTHVAKICACEYPGLSSIHKIEAGPDVYREERRWALHGFGALSSEADQGGAKL